MNDAVPTFSRGTIVAAGIVLIKITVVAGLSIIGDAITATAADIALFFTGTGVPRS